ncbi:MAG: amidophosphoribosyltransferase [Candidatus Omnitrophica bacterium CG08_land_8_20_14_0_20_41_16]|uniref:Amidophosphoribosyltransferase n=1 Tax=Candidatus Sherwoodlollariibacterium unditelluris TaxID=1974757 RepID=A0A2G9YLB8_9BACT|nr:MAG: amidophosphoribosyltransferase [Candidatus Omnitrophica bacterium CG23_combo_of_CG06-09_8_20_14_all_41_10]PIS33958.1 MAG: amidophosphoribosyltransferase [Candidatus Omnitrophica bacterium CG08_land_8_20_14_0_20_41_16]
MVEIDNDEPREYCGLFGIANNKHASWLTYLGLYALQHRGEEACGIVTNNKGILSIHKDIGLVSDVFNERVLHGLKGDIAVGHVRYSTTGSSVLKNAQPLLIDYTKGSVCIAHNGNLVNSLELRQYLEKIGSIFQTTTDSEIIIHLMARAKSRNLEESLIYALKRVKGAYALVMMVDNTLIGARDPLGFRPLSLGKLRNAWCLASETCAFDLTGAQYIREIEPGEVVFINGAKLKSIKPKGLRSNKLSFCAFEHIYFSRPDSVIFGETVHLVRRKLGAQLAREHPVDADFVVPVPDSGFSAAMGYSQESGIPLELGIIRNHYVGRTFIQPEQDLRNLGVRVKFNLLKDVLRDKRIIVVDDSIVRGTTSKIRIRSLRKAGVREVHLRISCPAHRFPCFYGIDFHKSSELIANKYSSIDKIRKYLEVDSLGYLSLDGMLNCFKPPKGNYCTACWTGKYPVRVKKRQGKFSLETHCCGQGELKG